MVYTQPSAIDSLLVPLALLVAVRKRKKKSRRRRSRERKRNDSTTAPPTGDLLWSSTPPPLPAPPAPEFFADASPRHHRHNRPPTDFLRSHNNRPSYSSRLLLPSQLTPRATTRATVSFHHQRPPRTDALSPKLSPASTPHPFSPASFVLTHTLLLSITIHR